MRIKIRTFTLAATNLGLATAGSLTYVMFHVGTRGTIVKTKSRKPYTVSSEDRTHQAVIIKVYLYEVMVCKAGCLRVYKGTMANSLIFYYFQK